jgi:hypothetical protein
MTFFLSRSTAPIRHHSKEIEYMDARMKNPAMIIPEAMQAILAFQSAAAGSVQW